MSSTSLGETDVAKPIAEFTQGSRPSPTTSELRISRSTSDPYGIYIQLVKTAPNGKQTNRMDFKVDHEDIDDIIVALQYAKVLTEREKEEVDKAWEPKS